MSDLTTIDINHIYRDSKFSQIDLISWKIVFICNECKLEKNFFCIDLSKYRLITIFLNSLPMIFKTEGECKTVIKSTMIVLKDESGCWHTPTFLTVAQSCDCIHISKLVPGLTDGHRGLYTRCRDCIVYVCSPDAGTAPGGTRLRPPHSVVR